jgi:integrase
MADGKTIRWYTSFYYTDWTGVRRRVVKRGFKTQREAKEYEKQYVDMNHVSCDILFSSLVENYYEDMAHRLKPTTMRSKHDIIDTKILPFFKNLKVNQIDVVNIRKWQNMLTSFRDENGQGYSATYLKTINNQLTAIFNYAVKNYRLQFNPCTAAGSIGKSKATEQPFWTLEQYKKFAAQIQKISYKVAFDILFWTGMRQGEMLALTPEDILPTMRIDINKNFAKVDGEEIFLIPKTSKSCRCISIPKFLYEEIMDYINKQYGIQKTDRIFYFTKSALTHEMAKATQAANLPKITIHGLRHSHASLLINMGYQAKEVADRLGHEKVGTTLDTYSHMWPDKDLDLANRLNNLKDE